MMNLVDGLFVKIKMR